MTTLLLLHGWGGDADSFAGVANYFRRDYVVLTPAFPCPPAGVVYDLNDYARDLWQYLQAHHVTRCAVIAHSFGARVLAVLNAAHPAVFTKIVVTGGAGLRPRFNLLTWTKIRLYKLGRALGLPGRGGSADYRDLDADGQATFRNVVNRDLTPEIAGIRVPLLLIWGNKDTATPLYLQKRWQQLVPTAHSIVYRGHGHFAYLTNQARFIKDVREFLA